MFKCRVARRHEVNCRVTRRSLSLYTTPEVLPIGFDVELGKGAFANAAQTIYNHFFSGGVDGVGEPFQFFISAYYGGGVDVGDV